MTPERSYKRDGMTMTDYMRQLMTCIRPNKGCMLRIAPRVIVPIIVPRRCNMSGR